MGKFFIGRTLGFKFLLSFNEGGKYFNFTLSKWSDGTWFFYIYLFGKRWIKKCRS